MSHDTDIVISGGGTTGMVLALALLRHTPLRVTLIDAVAAENTDAHPGFDARSVALAARSVALLEQAGVRGVASSGSAIAHIQVTDQGHLGQCELHADEYGLNELGRVIELHQLGRLLRDSVNALTPEQQQRFAWWQGQQVTTVERTDAAVTVTTNNSKTANGRLLVVAEGGQSPTRAAVGLTCRREDYGQHALIANVHSSAPHQHWAFERFTVNGPLALLPMPSLADNRAHCHSLVWTLPPEQALAMQAMDEAGFCRALQAQLGYRVGRILGVSERHVYPLQLQVADQVFSHRAVVIGNAAQTLHPIAGQGLNLGLRDIDALLNSITNSVQQQQDIGSFAPLSAYQQARRGDQHTTVSVTDALVRLFSNTHLPLVMGRNLGLVTMNLCAGLRDPLAWRAMGYTH